MRNLKFIIIWFAMLLLVSCYKEPFFNEKSFLIGNWKLIEVIIPPSSNHPNQEPIHINLEGVFNVEFVRNGRAKEFIGGVETRTFDIAFSELKLSRDSTEEDKLVVVFTDRKFIQDDLSYTYIFYLNDTRDTITSSKYPSSRVFPDYYSDLNPTSLPVFTFIKNK